MNAKIKQLAEQAGIGFTLWDDSGREMIDNYTPEERLTKFAELIVKECAKVCRDQPNVYALKADRDNCAIAIEEHFGVEERQFSNTTTGDNI